MGLHIVVVKDIPKVHSILRGWVGGKRASVFSCICVLHCVLRVVPSLTSTQSAKAQSAATGKCRRGPLLPPRLYTHMNRDGW